MAPTTDRTQYREVLARLIDKTQAKMPTLNGRLTKAAHLALQGDVTLHEDGAATVYSSTDPTRRYEVIDGTCTCRDYEQAPEHLCQHRLAAGLVRKAHELLPQAPPVEEPPAVAPAGIDPQHVTTIQGKPFVKFAGLLSLAHQRGLQSLETIFTYNDAELSLAQSTATFPFGTFTDVGDASPGNTNPKVRAHFRRVSATRAAARALREALNLDMVALEELGEGGD